MSFRDRVSHEEVTDALGNWEDIILDTDIIWNDSLTGWTLIVGVDKDDKARPVTITWPNKDKLRVASNSDILLKDIIIELKKLNQQMEFITEQTLTNHFKN